MNREPVTAGPQRGDRTARELLESMRANGDYPGLQYIVVSPDDTVFEFAAGLADVAAGRAMGLDTTLMAYSMSKTVTAVAVLQLVERGLVGLDHPIARYLPSQPYGEGVTIRHLLSHTGGIPNPLPLRWAHAASDHAAFDEWAALERVLARHGKRSASPGRRFRYSNIGYWLLGALVEHVTGASFRDFVRRNVLGPIGIGATELGYDVTEPERHAKGYLERRSLLNAFKGILLDRALIGPVEGRWVNIRDHYVDGAAVGGLVGTARAFGLFLRDQLQPRSLILAEGTRRLLYERQRATSGREVPMTLGWHTGSLHGVPTFFKEGGGGGFHCLMRVYPSAKMGSVLMINATTLDVTGLLDRLDRGFLR